MEIILFDLDGTITDPKIGITKSIQYALRSFQIYIEDLDSLCRHIGPPLKTTFIDSYGLDEKQTEEAIAKYREYFAVTGIFENDVYGGMEDLFAKLKAAGKKLILATSKPEIYAVRILEHFNLSGYFDDICGATLDHTRSAKEQVIRYALEKNHITDLSGVVMVGDRSHDTEGAKAVGIASVGVLFGYGSRDELIEAGADKLAETVDVLYDILIRL